MSGPVRPFPATVALAMAATRGAREEALGGPDPTEPTTLAEAIEENDGSAEQFVAGDLRCIASSLHALAEGMERPLTGRPLTPAILAEELGALSRWLLKLAADATGRTQDEVLARYGEPVYAPDDGGE